MDIPSDHDLGAAIAERAAASGIGLPPDRCRALALHARLVLERNPALHLTTVTEPHELVERHLGESFEGAALLPPDAAGLLVDLGSGNGYPGVPVTCTRPALRAVLVEASRKKAEFLRQVASIEGMPEMGVLDRQVQRPADLEPVVEDRLAGADVAGAVRVFTARSLGNWARLLPRLAPLLGADGRVLLWAGETVEKIARRTVWRRLELVTRRPLLGREQSWIWEFRRRTA